MITPKHAQTMARYNRWQNDNLYTAAATLADAERRKERGAFFGSIHGTFCHLLWGDSIWFSRFAGWPKPAGGIKDSSVFEPDWDRLLARRKAMDEDIIGWADGLDAAWLDGELVWYSGAAGREMRKARALLVTHVFNHQTHHRGQIHAMLTAAGAKPDDTDLMLLEGV
jgi:uncharacterized damage-inducible protein DinB